ncbi:hypothetical protein FIBSPDRAFT_904451 [Athelia psychrophila]|uniref:Uncharacterized protein n=1 Tax=Athelia psychrophila TaxID=1759441 RepID=A0A167URL8_9AGAM|nr:hypothetical protein FIBSPDRAFT_904451 [Fibularhizoctonia sp. CBS 109695]
MSRPSNQYKVKGLAVYIPPSSNLGHPPILLLNTLEITNLSAKDRIIISSNTPPSKAGEQSDMACSHILQRLRSVVEDGLEQSLEPVFFSRAWIPAYSFSQDPSTASVVLHNSILLKGDDGPGDPFPEQLLEADLTFGGFDGSQGGSGCVLSREQNSHRLQLPVGGKSCGADRLSFIPSTIYREIRIELTTSHPLDLNDLWPERSVKRSILQVLSGPLTLEVDDFDTAVGWLKEEVEQEEVGLDTLMVSQHN